MIDYKRVFALGVMVVLIFVIYVARLFFIQIIKHDDHLYFAVRQQVKDEVIKPKRGAIYDRDMNLLVYDKEGYSFYVNIKKAIKEKKDSLIIKTFADSLRVSPSYFADALSQKKSNVCIIKKLDAVKALTLKDVRVPFTYYEDDPTRVYKYNNLASHILGYVNREYVGTEGIESSLHKVLRGVDGTSRVIRDGNNDKISTVEDANRPAVPGSNIVLTISKDIQSALEEELKAGIQECQADYGMGIIMDPNTGEILALANENDYNPNNYNEYNDEVRRNKVIGDTYEPGSTFKGIAMASFLDKGLCNENESVFVENGLYKRGTMTITDSHRESNLTVKNIFALSSNIGMSKLSDRIDDETFYTYTRDFGFGLPTGIELPGEARGTLKTPDIWSKSTKSSISYGYEVSVTALQLCTAYSAIINGGKLFKPTIVKAYLDNNQNKIKEFQPTMIRQVISERTSAKMREFLVEVVKTGTGGAAAIKGMTVGGKTGTSRRVVGKEYSTEFYNSSFVGFFPAENPKYICLIVMNSPKAKGIYGGTVAAPVFAKIAKKIIKLDKDLKQYDVSPIDSKPTTPGSTPAGAKGKNDKVIITNSSKTAPDSIQAVTHKEVKVAALTELKVVQGLMPDLVGLSVRDAIIVLQKINIKYDLKGTGRVMSQSIPVGTKIKAGQKCELIGHEIKEIKAVLY